MAKKYICRKYIYINIFSLYIFWPFLYILKYISKYISKYIFLSYGPALSLSRMRTPSDPHERCRVKQSVSSAPRQLDSVQVTNPAPSI